MASALIPELILCKLSFPFPLVNPLMHTYASHYLFAQMERFIFQMNNYPNGPQPPYQPPSNPGYPTTGQMPPGYGPPSQPGYPQQPMPPGYPPMPPQQPAQPPKKKGKALWIILGIIGALVVCGAIANAGSHASSGTKVDTTANIGSSTTNSTNAGSTSSQPTQQHFKVGDTVKVGTDWQIVVNGIKTSSGGQYDTLKPGKRFIEVDVSMTNVSAQERSTSGVIDWTLLDSTGAKADWDSVSDGSAAEPDGKIEPGQTLRGTLAYQATATEGKFTLEFSPELFSSGQTLWDLSV